MDLYYQQVWDLLWPGILIEWSIDVASIYAIFRPFTGILRVLNRFNWLKFFLGAGLSYYLKIQGGFTGWDLFLIGSAPISFVTTFLFAL
jgi:hypothetical protein